MKKQGIINATLAGLVAGLSHTDLVVVGDAGLPIADADTIVDLSVTMGTPKFTEVLDALLGEIVVEDAWVADLADDFPAGEWVDSRLDFPVKRIPHSELKDMVKRCRVAIRTGEDTAYSNVILQCGVPFAI